MNLVQLDEALLKAHSVPLDNPSELNTLVTLYQKAYELTVHENRTAAYFYLTNAYVYALESNHSDVALIENTLKQAGRL